MRVLISGAGIAGPTLAYWLLRSGHEVTIVERAPALRSGGYLVDFWGAGFEVAERMGIVPELRRRGYVFTDAMAIDRGGRRIASIKPATIMKSGENYLSIVRSELSAVIYESLQGGAELILDDSVDSLEDDGTVVRVGFESGPVREFDLVVGADGLHSGVRRLAFGPDEQFERYLGIVFAAFESRGYRPRDELVAMMYAEIGFQVLRLSLDDDNALFLVSARHEGAVPEERPAQERLLRTVLKEAGWEVPAILELLPKAKEFFFDAVSQIRMPSWSRGRVVLVGDAGAAPSFLAGQGSALAMVGAYTLGAELARTGDHTEAFARYEERLAPLIRSKQDAAVGLGLAFAPKNGWELFIRNTAMRMMALPGVADLVMGRSFHDAVELPPFPESPSVR
ncbi:2-polyprenyl-6-methoxyphenol hydroxylase-like FAD-dependent oxidoreductase [Cryobacterium mesophilum]|uniref:FAD-binding domain n=1 Tax=Terrimesophilobacter mesophilus TaxID=433647 RepID=A0A4V6QGE7_9MICO|nr:FAD-binding domain [Terrimesophilobacter mesophilus]MBB5633090.1 2-polyprenyl-6-methoxyphenol hydroxylase-like FAD-dependent oxidoreductase [Terrimesophilobacter mesophilus]TFB79848.1 FAD-binding domain [Terrimesophilobacter mesophilus]